MPTKRDFSSLVSDSADRFESVSIMGTPTLKNKRTKKRLRRLPHVFSKVLELPLSSDADVSVEDSPDCFRFVAKADFLDGGLDVWAHIIEDYPGVKKVVLRREGCNIVGGFLSDEMGLDMWRFRLPANTRPEAAKAVCGGGQLVVTVPKKSGGGWERATMENLVVVQ